MSESEPVRRRPLSLCVFCASRPGNTPDIEAAARDTGTLIGRLGWQLVYGGGHSGLMGTLADAALAAGAAVVGVIPQSLMTRELGHTGVSELHVVNSMHERKQMMAERSDAFVALPGGIGTLEELFEVWTWRQLGYHDKPVGLLNTGGYYDALLDFVGRAQAGGFVTAQQRSLLDVDTGPAALLGRIARLCEQPRAAGDYSRT